MKLSIGRKVVNYRELSMYHFLISSLTDKKMDAADSIGSDEKDDDVCSIGIPYCRCSSKHPATISPVQEKLAFSPKAKHPINFSLQKL